MKSIKINHYPKLDIVDIKQAAEFLAQQANFEQIDSVNWPELFPAKPPTKFIIARSTNSIFIHYKVHEKQIRAIYIKDQDPVWQDSCVEFFCQLPNSTTYFNFEFNCIGTCLATERKGREEDVRPFSSNKMTQIKRYASLGNEPFEEKKGDFDWHLTVEIPFSLLNIDTRNLPTYIKANFYKCGDKTSVPHYLSWNPIQTEKPDFHRPKFFGELQL